MLEGSFVALVTPFKEGEIDYNSYEKLIDFHIKNKTDGILLCGTTGESPSLASDEKERFVRFGIQKIEKKVPVMVGTGSNNLSHTIAATTNAAEWGADYALVITPYYNKPTQEGMYYYFKAVATNTDIPIVIYNVPGRTGVNINADTTLRLAKDFKNIVGIKEASGDLNQISRIVKNAPEGFSVMSGEDALNLPIMSCGGKGAISVTANIVPQMVHNLVEFALKNKFKKALEIHLKLLDLNYAMFLETNPIPVKEALYLMKMIEREIRLPLYYISKANKVKLQKILEENKLI
ncbi:MAG: 4-hydroxy-tetrahydrodipicolinate synthase [Candidatus Cloacimonadota bacterium]|nr:4-hydroxy-tetrahydrodipicolinate synthase [Candidatus Cloacimonadota bacterium]